MFKKLILVISLSVIAANTYAQNIEIRGQIIDRNTESPVSEAYVTTSTGEARVTDGMGYFRLFVSSIPATLRISHVSYGISEYKVATLPKGLLVIRINQKIIDLDEVRISGKQLLSLTQKDPYSIQDFAIDQKTVWFLGFKNNQSNLKRLFMATLYGDTLASVPAKGAESLFQDVFHNVHLVCKDTVYQLFNTNDFSIELLYPIVKNQFFSLMADIELAMDQILIYSRMDRENHSRIIYFIRKDDPVQHLLTVITDTAEANRQNQSNSIDRLMGPGPTCWNIPTLISMWSTISMYSKRGTKFGNIIRHDLPYGLFQSDNDLYIVNYLKDSLLVYSADGKFSNALHIDFHKGTLATGTKYKNLSYLTDPLTQKVYILERQISHLALRPLNPILGKTEDEILLPDFPGMDGICVYGNAVYFLYQERIHPFYTRLYRYQL
jgi:hypothetical protein